MKQWLWIAIEDQTSAQSNELQEVFSVQGDSIFCRALSELGMDKPQHQMTRFKNQKIYFNRSELLRLVTCGSIELRSGPDHQILQIPQAGLKSLFRLMRLHWRMEKICQKFLQMPLANLNKKDALYQSVLSGLCVQALLMRLPSSSEESLALWFAQPEKAPLGARQVLGIIEQIQKKRMELSGAWKEILLSSGDTASDFFWESQDGQCSSSLPFSFSAGLKVFPGKVEDRYYCPDREAPALGERGILVFLRARPEAVEYFAQASGLIFGTGGLLAHACVVAREQGIPCLTGIGVQRVSELQVQLQNEPGKRLKLDCDSMKIEVIS